MYFINTHVVIINYVKLKNWYLKSNNNKEKKFTIKKKPSTKYYNKKKFTFKTTLNYPNYPNYLTLHIYIY